MQQTIKYWLDAYMQDYDFGSTNFYILTVGTFVMHELVFILCNLPYVLIETNQLFKEYKIQKNVTTNAKDIWKVFWNGLIMHFLLVMPLIFAAYPIMKWIPFTTELPLPNWSVLAIQFVIFNIIEDVLFYLVHRLLHVKVLYMYVHYKHHEYKAPFSLIGNHAHWFEFVFNFFLPFISGPILMGRYYGQVHIFTLWIWLLWREYRGAEAHCGYSGLPWQLANYMGFLYGGSDAHDLHHLLYNYNYGGYNVMDKLFGTYKDGKQKMAEINARKEN